MNDVIWRKYTGMEGIIERERDKEEGENMEILGCEDMNEDIKIKGVKINKSVKS
jgi:hypothetical protein